MPRKLLRRWSPDPQKIRNAPGVRLLGKLLDDPNLFHLNRHSVSVAFFVGIFVGFLPIPGQIPLAALLALLLRCNLPISVTLVWISNPFTFPVIFYGTYKLGAWMLGEKHEPFTFELSWQWLTTGFPAIWQPLMLGSVAAGLFFGTLFYFLVRWGWRWHVIDRWKQRRDSRR